MSGVCTVSRLQFSKATLVDSTRVAVSTFPRQIEAHFAGLMTALAGRSGRPEALACGPGAPFELRTYSFSRLTCHSQGDWPTRRTLSGSTLGRGLNLGAIFSFVCGAFPPFNDDRRFWDRRAPVEPEDTCFWSTATSVDSAGWTEVVIQERRLVVSYVIIGRKAEVNASIDCVLETASYGGGRLVESGGISFDKSTCGCPGRSDVGDSSFSCLSFNEVTK